MWDETTARELTAAVAELKTALSEADTYEATMQVLALVPLEVLNLIEEEFRYLWTPPQELRSRIAYEHLRRQAKRHEPWYLSEVTPRTVTEWAESALEQWLPGITDPDERGQQYRITLDPDGVYQVQTADGHGAVRYHVTVSVVEAT